MQKIVIVILLLIGLFIGFYSGNIYKTKNKKVSISKLKVKPTSVKNNKTKIMSKSIFVPSWGLIPENHDFSDYDELLYFGITPDYQGINKEDAGYLGIDKFMRLAGKKKKLITLRMLNDDINNSVLKDVNLQNKIIEQTLEIVEQYKADGIILDLEISGLYESRLRAQINDFVQIFY